MLNVLKPAPENLNALHELIQYYADRKEMLPRTIEELSKDAKDFFVLICNHSQKRTQNKSYQQTITTIQDDSNTQASDNSPNSITEQLLACAHLDLFTPTLAEVKSLAVQPEYKGKGYGRMMVEACENEARKLGIERVFALTYQVEFFKHLGYKVIDINSLPEKVFKECVICPFKDNCNETAVLKLL